jgi:hypothetical protein
VSKGQGPRGGGGREKKQCTYVLYSAWNWLRRAFGVVIFFIAFFCSPYRETPKNAIKKSARGKKLDARPRKTFFITFLFLSFPCREALNQRNKKVERKKNHRKPPESKIPPPPPPKKYFPGEFFGNVLIFFPRVFELPLPRNAQKRTKKKKYVRTYFLLRAGADVRRYPIFFSAAPLAGVYAGQCHIRDRVGAMPGQGKEKLCSMYIAYLLPLVLPRSTRGAAGGAGWGGIRWASLVLGFRCRATSHLHLLTAWIYKPRLEEATPWLFLAEACAH